jgi:RNA polymerase sigma-70 factor (ECF subfamily)
MGLKLAKPDTAAREERFTREVWPHLPAVLRLARMLIRNAAEADDLAQDVMVKAFNNLDRFTGDDIRPWLYAILRNARIDRLRSTANDREVQSLDAAAVDLPDSAPADTGPGRWDQPAEMLEAFSDAQVVDAMKSLPEEIRWTLLLVDVEGLDHVQAASILSIPVGTVKSRAHRGRSMLRDALLPVARRMGLLKT